MKMKNVRLDAVAKAKQAYVLAKASLEHRLREQLREEIRNLQTQIDISVRYAYDSGESKADIMTALGTKDYHTINACLERTSNVANDLIADPYAEIFTMIGSDTVVVSYDQHGPNGYSGEASFNIKKLDNGGYLFLSLDPLWSEDYTVRNDVVAALDGKTDGFYYEELVEWVSGR